MSVRGRDEDRLEKGIIRHMPTDKLGQQRLTLLSRERIKVRNSILSLVADDVIEILHKCAPTNSKLLVDRLEYLLSRDDQLAIDIAAARRDIREAL